MSKKNTLKDEKYHIGRFSITGNKDAISFVGVVEIKNSIIGASFWVNGDSFDGNVSISMFLSSIELRSIAKAIIVLLKSDNFDFKKNTGGSNTSKELSIKLQNESVWINLQYVGKKASVSLSKLEALALSDEIKILVDLSVDSSYKMQRLVSQKKANLKNKDS